MAVSRNEFCPCGSGKKYKKCCLGAPSEKAVRRARLVRMLAALVVVATALSFVLAGKAVGSAVGLAGFGVMVAVVLLDDGSETASSRPARAGKPARR